MGLGMYITACLLPGDLHQSHSLLICLSHNTSERKGTFRQIDNHQKLELRHQKLCIWTIYRSVKSQPNINQLIRLVENLETLLDCYVKQKLLEPRSLKTVKTFGEKV
jgi:hypothetical protein